MNKTISLISLILCEENINILEKNKILSYLSNNTSYRVNLSRNRLLSINASNQKFIYIPCDNLLIKENDNGIHIIYFDSDNSMILLNLDYNNKKYKLYNLSKKNETYFVVDKDKMLLFKKDERIKQRQLYLRKNYKDEDFILLERLISSTINKDNLENKVLSYIETISPRLKEEISEIIKYTANYSENNGKSFTKLK
jgi:hypothetical protein